MDGSTSAFLYETPFLSSREDGHAGGILYIEDFDSELLGRKRPVEPTEPDATPLLTQEDLDLARAEGHTEGMQSALADATHVQAQMATAALQSLGESLVAARVTLERVAAQQAAECARAMIAVMLAAIPATMARHGEVEIQAMLDVLLPRLLCEPELRVRAHPDLADLVRERLAERLPSEGIVLSVVADAKLGLGDIDVAWQRGQARRTCKPIWDAIRVALGSLNLPTLEEVCLGNGS